MSKRPPLSLLKSEQATAKSRLFGQARAVRARLAPRALAADAAEAVAMRAMLAVGKPGSSRRRRMLAASSALVAFGAAIALRTWQARAGSTPKTTPKIKNDA